MPVYEYVCKACASPFEELVRGDERVACPACKSATVEKRFSTFATNNGAPALRDANESAAGCGTCGDPRGPGACATN